MSGKAEEDYRQNESSDNTARSKFQAVKKRFGKIVELHLMASGRHGNRPINEIDPDDGGFLAVDAGFPTRIKLISHNKQAGKSLLNT